MKVLLAGASGALGIPLTRELIAHGHQVIGLTRSRGGAGRIAALGAAPVVAVAEMRSRRPGMTLQIGIPKQVREIFVLRPGDSLLLLADREKGIALVDPAEYTELTDKIIGPGPDASGAAGEGS